MEEREENVRGNLRRNLRREVFLQDIMYCVKKGAHQIHNILKGNVEIFDKEILVQLGGRSL